MFQGAAAVLMLSALAAAQGVAIREDHGDFVLTGAQLSSEPAEGWGTVFRVYAGSEQSQPVLGSYAATGGDLIFHPRFPRAGNVAYRAVFLPTGLSETFAAAVAPVSSARVDQIYPSIDVLPANVLKLYIRFSAPMSRGEAWQRIHLLDEAGTAVPLAFLEIEQELWDAENRRLTVLFDPGRIKRGLVPSDDMGTPIAEGRRYTLQIDREWRDARGVAMAEGFRRAFRGGPVDRDPPDPGRWRYTAPKAGTREPLVVDFAEPMDFGLVQRLLVVEGVEGAVEIGPKEMQWRFTPKAVWKAGGYRITAENALEDIAGNRLNRAFDVDTTMPVKHGKVSPRTTLSFVVQ